jgi:SAM-dependent methyltransferase
MQTPKGLDAQRRAHIQSTYDQLAEEYARHLSDELLNKPLDCQLLDRFAAQLRDKGLVCDMGCGPGQVARYLHERGVVVCGIDLSPEMVAQARRLHPDIRFAQGDLLELAVPDGAFAGLTAFYSIVHLPKESLPQAFAELWRVLQPGGSLVLAFHVGDERVQPAELWGIPVTLDWLFFPTQEIAAQLAAAGFELTEVVERAPYPGAEHPSQRAYILARRGAVAS